MKIVFVGLSGVPYSKRACDTRLLSFASMLHKKEHTVVILNKFTVDKKIKDQEINLPPFLRIIELYKGTRPKGLLNYIIKYLSSYAKEASWLLRDNKKGSIDILHLYTGHYIDFLIYFLIAKIIRSKVVYQYVEFRSGMERSGVYHKINGFLCDRFGYKLFDGVIAISTFIESKIQLRAPQMPQLKVPPVCDLKYFEGITPPVVKQSYILFCGNAGFYDVIQLIIDSYRISNIADTYKLILVLTGSDALKERVSSYAGDDAKIISDLDYEDLVKNYLGATALLIPLRNSIQDIARFPNKICEYTACKGLIITNSFGEIPYYFRDNESALIAEDFSEESFAKKLNLLTQMEANKISQIRTEAHNLCRLYFDISAHAEDLNIFLERVNRK